MQRVSDVPSLLNNRFSYLHVDPIPDGLHVDSIPYESKSIPDTSEPTPVSPSTRFRRPHWERRLPHSYIVAATPSERSLHVKVELQTTDTSQVFGMRALLDSGATGLFIDSEYVKSNRMPTRKLSRPIPVFNVDGTPNEAGQITEIVDVILRFKDHSERAQFAVTRLGKQHMILGHTWLQFHNPEVNWKTSDVVMSRCPSSCSTCRADAKRERLAEKAHTRRI